MLVLAICLCILLMSYYEHLLEVLSSFCAMKSTVIIIFTLIESIVDYCIVFLPYPHKLKLTHINNMLIKKYYDFSIYI